MKTSPIRCGPSFKRQIRAIAQPTIFDPNSPNEEKPRDSCPTLKFFEEAKGLYPDSWADLLLVINETAKNGPPNNSQKFKYVRDGVYEFKSWKLRLLCFMDDDSLIICINGIFKHKQEASPRDIEHAKKQMNAYFEAKKRGELYHG